MDLTAIKITDSLQFLFKTNTEEQVKNDLKDDTISTQEHIQNVIEEFTLLYHKIQTLTDRIVTVENKIVHTTDILGRKLEEVVNRTNGLIDTMAPLIAFMEKIQYNTTVPDYKIQPFNNSATTY